MKGTKMNLTEFLSDDKGGGVPMAPVKIDWAAEMETTNDHDDMDDFQYGRPAIDRSKLPTAPKASRGPDVDASRIPNNAPFTAFIGNLSYDITDDKIADFFSKQNVINVRLPQDQGRLKGYGYVEFEDKQSLLDALLLNDEVLCGRKLRVDLAGQNQQGDQRGGGGGFNRDRQNDGPDRTEGDWRSRPPPDSDYDRGNDRYGDRGGDRYGDRGDRYGDRGGDRYGDRGDDRYGDRGGNRYGDRGGDRYGDRGGDRYGDRGGDRYGDRGGDRYGDRRDRYDNRRGGGYDRRDGGYDRRDGYDQRDGGYDRRDGGYDRRDGYNRRDGYDRRDGHDRRDGGYGRDRYDDRGGDRRGYGSGFRRDDRRSPEPMTERPRLNLQPRSKPVDNPPTEMKSPPAPEVESPKPSKPSAASIFGGARPVDTTAREREIEERLQRQRLEDSRKLEEEKENRNINNPSDRGYRNRRDSENSQEDGHGGRRERRLSSGSSSKGRSGPPPVTSQRSRKDSDRSNHSQEVFSREEGEEPKSPVSPSQGSDQSKSPSSKEESVKLVPAPPPSVNAWQKRRSEGKTATVSVVSGAVETTSPSSQKDSRSPQEAIPHQRSTSPKGHPAESRYTEPSKSNPWFKNKDVSNHSGQGRGDYPGQSREYSGRGRGRGSDRGRGRGGKSSAKNREKNLPRSLDEMPKFEEKSNKDWSDRNKFAGLTEDDDDQVDEET